MAEKHKSKYKKPENKKSTPRKDLKDYTMDDKSNGLNPFTTGDKHLGVLRKTDKEMQDDGKMYPTYNADDRLYKDLEDADYDPKTAAKRLKKRQDDEEKNTSAVLKDKIENLTREQKERLVREYVRRKIEKVLYEQPTPTEEPTEEAPEAPEAAAAPSPETPPAPEAPAPETPTEEPVPTETPAPEASTEEPEASTEEPAADKVEKELDPEAKEALAVQRFVDHLKGETGNIARLKAISKVINATMREAEPEDYTNFYELLRSLAINKLSTGNKSKK